MAFPVRFCPQGNIGLVKFFSRISRCKLVITSLVAWQDNVYVAWRDLSGSEGAGTRVAVSYGLNPPVFTQNQRVGNSLGEGLRLAKALYYVYGNRDATIGNNRLAIRQIMADRAGNTTIGSEYFVTGQVQASIPQVAVTNNGTVGVFYYTFDGFSDNNLPIFTTYLQPSGAAPRLACPTPRDANSRSLSTHTRPEFWANGMRKITCRPTPLNCTAS